MPKRLQGFLKCHSPPPRSCPLPEWVALIGLEHIFVISVSKKFILKSIMSKRLGFLKCHSTPPKSCPLLEWAAFIGLELIFVISMSKTIILKSIMSYRLGVT
jgi:hypothetical protein